MHMYMHIQQNAYLCLFYMYESRLALIIEFNIICHSLELYVSVKSFKSDKSCRSVYRGLACLLVDIEGSRLPCVASFPRPVVSSYLRKLAKHKSMGMQAINIPSPSLLQDFA